MATYRKRPLEVEAVRWDGYNWWEILDLTEGSPTVALDTSTLTILVGSLEGRTLCTTGNWIVKGVWGEFYVVAGESFEATYEEAPERFREPYPEECAACRRSPLDDGDPTWDAEGD